MMKITESHTRCLYRSGCRRASWLAAGWGRGQAGAMFGMDARIALIVAAILVAAGGITVMSRIERDKVNTAEAASMELRSGLLRYYTTIGINKLPDSLDQLFANGMIENPAFQRDAWGNPWYYEKIEAPVRLEGTPITVHYAIIYSGGKDGVPNSPNLNTDADFAQWETLKDDVGIKVSTRDIELKRLEEYRARGQLVVDKIEAAEASAFIEAQATCLGTTPPGWCEDTEGKNYTQFNYYPPSSLAATDEMVSYPVKILTKAPYVSGDENDMQQLMLDLGLPPGYAKDPWGRVLQYHSNITQRTDPPFAASICYSFGEDCFAQTTP